MARQPWEMTRQEWFDLPLYQKVRGVHDSMQVKGTNSEITKRELARWLERFEGQPYTPESGIALDDIGVDVGTKSHAMIVEDAVMAGKAVPLPVFREYQGQGGDQQKAPWEMTYAEVYPSRGVCTIKRRGTSTYVFDDAVPAGMRPVQNLKEVVRAGTCMVGGHEAEVIDAVNAGKPVPVSVLESYPSIQRAMEQYQRRGPAMAEKRRGRPRARLSR